MKTIVKNKFNYSKFFIVLLILYIIGFLIYNIFQLPIRHIKIINNNILKDKDILSESKLDNYPSFLLTTDSNIKNNLKNNPYLKDIEITRSWFCNLTLNISEYKVLFYDNLKGQVVLENYKLLDDKQFNLPILINDVPETIYNTLIDEMVKVREDILRVISEIEYQPNEIDKERFVLTMNDGNYVYLTLYTFSKINKYDEIVTTIEGKKGILYLDSGNYFEIID